MSVAVSWNVSVHPAEEVLEEYGFGRVHEPALSALEEHLLVCPACRTSLEELDEYAALMKAAMASFERDRGKSPRGSSWFPIPATVRAGILLAAGTMLAFFAASLAWRAQSVPATATVQLASLRGGDGVADSLAAAPAGRPLDLSVNAASLPPAAGYRLELVDQAGRTLWTGEANVSGAQLSAHVPTGPRPGVYWVRLYTARGELLREFGMRLQ